MKTTDTNSITCFSNIIENLDNLDKTGLFSPERMSEIRNYLSDDKFGQPRLDNGKCIPEWIVHFDSGLMWTESMFKSSKFFIYNRILERFLSKDEVDKINNYANSRWQERNEAKRFDAAKKVTEREWDGRVFHNDIYYESVDDFKDMYYNDDDELPEFVWAVDEEDTVLNFDYKDVIERFTQDAYDDFDSTELNGLPEFKLAVEKFVEANKDFKSWNSSLKIAVMLDKEIHRDND